MRLAVLTAGVVAWVGAALASLCCLLPLTVIVLGLGSGAFMATTMQYRWLLVSCIRSRVNIGHGYSQEAPWPIAFALSQSARLTGMSSSGFSERRRRLPGSVAGLAPCC